MEARTGIAIGLLLVGCVQPQVSNGNAEPIVPVTPMVAPRPGRQKRNTPRRFKLRLTLDQPEDLKVKVGDGVIKGQVIGDRPSARTNLIQEREILQQQLKQLQGQTNTSRDTVEQAEVEQARLRVEQARSAIASFHADSPWTDYARRVLPLADSSQLGELKAEYWDAKGELAVAIAKLQQVKRQTTINQNRTTRPTELIARIRMIEGQLDTLGIVRSPFSGQIKTVKWLGQTDHLLQVDLTITLASHPVPQVGR